MSIYLSSKLELNKPLLDWYLTNTSFQVDETTKNTFLQLKNNIEGWKKGTQIRTQKNSEKSSLAKIKENLSLYLNQIGMANYATIEKKIIIEIDNSNDAKDILIDLVLSNNLVQINNLPILVQLLTNLKYLDDIIRREEQILYTNVLREIDQDNYDQLCVDNRYNLLFKNGFLFLGLIFNGTEQISITKMVEYFEYLEKHIIAETSSKEFSEKYIDIYVELIKLVDVRLKCKNIAEYEKIKAKLIVWKDNRQKYTNRARFSILDYLDTQ